jgi:hypothetical protein
MTKPKLRKNADISSPQSPHDGIHTCSKGCKKPGCTRTLRETIEENARLKAEVERLTAFTTRTIIPNEELQAQVERLTKAGDAMEDAVIDNGLERMNEARDGWNAAKEGKNL